MIFFTISPLSIREDLQRKRARTFTTMARKSEGADEEGLLSVPSNKQGLDNVRACLVTHVCMFVCAHTSHPERVY